VPTIFVADVRKPVVSMWKQKEAVALDGIAASAAGGELYTAQLASRSITSSQPVVFSWKTSELSVKRGEVLRAIPPAAALIDMQDPRLLQRSRGLLSVLWCTQFVMYIPWLWWQRCAQHEQHLLVR
jgi:hypothetical protein